MISNEKDMTQILGILMKKPNLLSKVDKYNLSFSDFSTRFTKYIFGAIKGLYENGAQVIDVIDIENFLDSNGVAAATFQENRGVEYLQDALDFSQIENFDYYYNHLKKINLLRDLEKSGTSISDFYVENPVNQQDLNKNRDFENLSIQDIIDELKRKLYGFERSYCSTDVSQTRSVADGIGDLINESYNREDVGLPIQGSIMNEVMGGARLGTLTIRASKSGVGKTRSSVGDACFLAFPIRYDWELHDWVQEGSNETVLFIATEQSFKEIQRMILAYLTGINESKFRYGQFTKEEERVIKQGVEVIKTFQDNFQITQMPNPTNELIKSVIRENVLLYNISYIFYDYIFIGPALLSEFKGFNLRNDELLLLLATTLKDLAVELNVFIMTSTQVNANADENKGIKNEAALAGGRSTINKADYGFIMSRPTKEELNLLEKLNESQLVMPNLVTDVFKVRNGEWTQVRIWSTWEAGTLRKIDWFMTDDRFNLVDFSNSYSLTYEDWSFKGSSELMRRIKEIE